MKNTNYRKSIVDSIMKSLPATLVMAAVVIFVGIFFIVSQSRNEPIERRDAISYSGVFEKYKSRKNDCKIYFEDGSKYSVYPHTQTNEFRQTMMSLNKGTNLYILVNPNNHCVIEIKTDTEELLNFESSQKAIDEYDNFYIVMGYILCAGSVFLVIYGVCLNNYKRKENALQAEKIAKIKDKGVGSPVLRHADLYVKNKILSEASAGGYTICYRRVKSVNELVINGEVYDEKKGFIEFEHKLCASLGGHSFEAGLDKNSNSYIMFDGEIIEYNGEILEYEDD